MNRDESVRALRHALLDFPLEKSWFEVGLTFAADPAPTFPDRMPGEDYQEVHPRDASSTRPWRLCDLQSVARVVGLVTGSKISTIKVVRSLSLGSMGLTLGLKEAKDLIDALWQPEWD